MMYFPPESDEPDFPLSTGVPCTFYQRPNGTTHVAEFKNMRQDDADWFTANNVNLSGETIGTNYAFYADVGATLDDDETPDEAIVIVNHSADPYDTMHELL